MESDIWLFVEKLVFKAEIKFFNEFVLVYILTYENYFYHSVVILIISVTPKVCIFFHHIHKLVLWHIGKPKTGIFY